MRPYDLYRASVPVQYSYTSTPPMDRTACTEPQCPYSTAIPQILLWAVRPVQSLSACTVQLYLKSSCGPYGLYRASVPVRYRYTSNPPVGHTACTEPPCPYKGAPQCLYKVEHNFFLHVSTLSCHPQGASATVASTYRLYIRPSHKLTA
jgi:hypothetical protein